MKLFFVLTIIYCMYIPEVNGQGTFVPSKHVPRVLTPGAAVGLDGERDGFKKVSQKKNVTKWIQTIDGIPVYGSVLTTHSDKKGMIEAVQGFVSHTASLVDTTPVIDSQKALDILKAHWKHDTNECMLKFRINTPVLNILESESGWDHLIWYIEYYVEMADLDASIDDSVGTPPTLVIGMVNAHTGKIEDTWNDLARAEIKAVVGNKKIGKRHVTITVERDGNQCRHRDNSRRVEVFDIYNQKMTTFSETTSKFQCEDAANEDWDLVHHTDAYSPRNEVYAHASMFVDMWEKLVGDKDDIYETSSSFLNFYVHYFRNSEEAFFDGEVFKFGDGKDYFYPQTSIDIVCHEIGHAITTWHGSKLQYRQQSGAINEAYSDILGETCDIYHYNKKDALIGAEVTKKNPKVAIRNMCDPSSIGKSLDHLSKYNDKTDVHYSSGIYNKAWCLLKNTQRWDYKMAFQVFTEANLRYWKPTTTMHCGACGVESAAADEGYNKNDVTVAFKAVGVFCDRC